jgi:hypothetical protein
MTTLATTPDPNNLGRNTLIVLALTVCSLAAAALGCDEPDHRDDLDARARRQAPVGPRDGVLGRLAAEQHAGEAARHTAGSEALHEIRRQSGRQSGRQAGRQARPRRRRIDE